jgi:hypothetical protein
VTADQIDHVVASPRFNIRDLVGAAWTQLEVDPRVAPCIPGLQIALGRYYSFLAAALLRHCFLIELVKTPAIDSTKTRTRWFSALEGEPRWCSFEECREIAIELILSLSSGWLDTAENLEAIQLCFDHAVLPYEVPLDYVERPTDHSRIHRSGNMAWMATPEMLRALRLRKYLTTEGTSPDAKFFTKVIDEKIKIKTYLTDRVLTGAHKTNREKRWEVHPRSVHFADRRTCMAIEHLLIQQLCAFDGFPETFLAVLKTEGVIPTETTLFECPITRDPMSFSEFKTALENPSHGRSAFQVGHLNPLKLEALGETASGHTRENISWVSADGNRIQGSLSLADVRTMLRRIARNYGWS